MNHSFFSIELQVQFNGIMWEIFFVFDAGILSSTFCQPWSLNVMKMEALCVGEFERWIFMFTGRFSLLWARGMIVKCVNVYECLRATLSTLKAFVRAWKSSTKKRRNQKLSKGLSCCEEMILTGRADLEFFWGKTLLLKNSNLSRKALNSLHWFFQVSSVLNPVNARYFILPFSAKSRRHSHLI